MTKHETFMKMQKFRERRWLSTSVAGGKSCLKSELTPGSRTCREPTERPWIRTFWSSPCPQTFSSLKEPLKALCTSQGLRTKEESSEGAFLSLTDEKTTPA